MFLWFLVYIWFCSWWSQSVRQQPESTRCSFISLSLVFKGTWNWCDCVLDWPVAASLPYQVHDIVTPQDWLNKQKDRLWLQECVIDVVLYLQGDSSTALQFLWLLLVVVIVVQAVELQAWLLPQCPGHELLLHKQFLEEAVADAEGEVAVDEVHEAHAGASIVTCLWLRCEQRLNNGVNNRSDIWVGLAGKALKQVLGLNHIVLAILLE